MNCRLRIVKLAALKVNLRQVVQRDDEALEDVLALARLAQQELRAPGNPAIIPSPICPTGFVAKRVAAPDQKDNTVSAREARRKGES